MFSRTKTTTSTQNYSAGIHKLASVLETVIPLSSEPAPVFQQQAVLSIPVNALKSIFQILLRNTIFRICIPAVSIHSRTRTNSGHTGPDTFTSTVI